MLYKKNPDRYNGKWRLPEGMYDPGHPINFMKNYINNMGKPLYLAFGFVDFKKAFNFIRP